jgi:hypothetical protein
MTSTSTNYGWTLPTSSDLVKNGATAISTVGQSVDTFLFRPFSKNALINGGFDIWQRGTSISLSASSGVLYTADRWAISTAASQACTVSRQATGDTTNLPFVQYAMRVQRNSGQTGTGLLLTTQSLESVNAIPFAGKTVTVSFYARAGANYSSASSALTAYFMTGTGTDQNRQSGGYTGEVTGSNTATLTTTWQRFSYSYAVASTATEAAVGFAYTPVGTASTNDYFEVTGVQLEAGSQATPYSRNAGTIQGELAACQRYYHRFSGGGTNDSLIGSGLGFSTTVAMFVWHLGTTMRTAPSSMDLSNEGVYRPANATGYSGGTWALNQSFDNSVRVIYTHGSAIFTAGESLIPNSTSATNYIGFSAEL